MDKTPATLSDVVGIFIMIALGVLLVNGMTMIVDSQPWKDTKNWLYEHTHDSNYYNSESEKIVS